MSVIMDNAVSYYLTRLSLRRLIAHVQLDVISVCVSKRLCANQIRFPATLAYIDCSAVLQSRKPKLPPGRVGASSSSVHKAPSKSWHPDFGGVWNNGRRLNSRLSHHLIKMNINVSAMCL